MTATQRKNLIALTKLLGFRTAGAREATAAEVFTLATTPAADVVLPHGTQVRTASVTEPVVFQLLSDVVIPAGASPPAASGTLEHSEPQDELFASTGLPNQVVVLPATPYLDGSAQVTAGNGDYALVQNFLSSTASDRHFLVLVDQADRRRAGGLPAQRRARRSGHRHARVPGAQHGHAAQRRHRAAAMTTATLQDLTAPRVVGAPGRELARVRVSFDEAVKQADADAPDDAINPVRYVLTRISAPAVEASVIGVEPVTSSAVDLLTNLPDLKLLEDVTTKDVKSFVLAPPGADAPSVPYPGLVAGGEHAIVGEVYAVDEATLAALDRLEGPPDFHRRASIVLVDGTSAETYLLTPEQVAGHPVIASGSPDRPRDARHRVRRR